MNLTRRAFLLGTTAYGGGDIPGVGEIGLREFSSTASNVIIAILDMYAHYERDAPTNPGKVPFYACRGVKAIQGAYGVNYEPKFELVAWVERSKIPDFDEHTNGTGNGRPVGGMAAQMPTESVATGAQYSEINPPPPLDDEIPF